MPWDRPRIARESLRGNFSDEGQGNSNSAGGRFNAGIYVVRRRSDNLRCIEKRLRQTDIKSGAAHFEMSLLRQLRHESITEYIDGFIVKGENPKASIYMEYCDRGTLADAIDKQRRKGSWFEEMSMWNLFAQIANAVAYCQYGIEDAVYHPQKSRDPSWLGIIHRDIKPANIFFRTGSRSGTLQAVLGDFGIAVREEEDRVHRSGGGYINPHWACPEYPKYTFASDVWAVGMVVQTACRLETEGRRPKFWGVGSRYTRRLDDAVHETMRQDPQNRPRIDGFAPKLAKWT